MKDNWGQHIILKKFPGLCWHLKSGQGEQRVAVHLWVTLGPKSCSAMTSVHPFLPAIPAEGNHSALGCMAFLLASSLAPFRNKIGLHGAPFSSLPVVLVSSVPFVFSDVCCCSISPGFFSTAFSACFRGVWAVIFSLHSILCATLPCLHFSLCFLVICCQDSFKQ